MLEQALLKFTNSFSDFMGKQKKVNEQFSQTMDHVEKSQGELIQRMENMEYMLSILAITYFANERSLMEESGSASIPIKEDESWLETLKEEHNEAAAFVPLVDHLETTSNDIETVCQLEEVVVCTSSLSEKFLPFHANNTPSEEHTDPSKPTFKPLSNELRYAFLGDDNTWPIVISFSLSMQQNRRRLDVLSEHMAAIRLSISDLKGISPFVYTHHIYMEDEAKRVHQPQKQLNPHMKEVV